MREYGKVAVSFWTGRSGKQLRDAGPEAMLLALYAMTSPHASMIGLYRLPLAYITNDTGLSLESVLGALRELDAAGLASYDPESEYIWLPEMARFECGERLEPTDKRVRHIQRLYEILPGIALTHSFFCRYGEPFNLRPRMDHGSPSPGSSKPGEGTVADAEPRAETSSGNRTGKGGA